MASLAGIAAVGLARLAMILVFLLVSVHPSWAAPPGPWERIIPTKGRGEINSIAYVEGGPLIVAGFVSAPRGNPQPWVASFGIDGAELWSLTFNGRMREEATLVAVDSGGSIFVGSSQFASALSFSAVISKITPDGKLVWSTVVERKDTRIMRLIPDEEGGALVLASRGSVLGARDVSFFVARLDEGGTVDWLNDTFSGTEGSSVAAGPNSYMPGDAGRVPYLGSDSYAHMSRRGGGRIELRFPRFGAGACFVINVKDGAAESGLECNSPPLDLGSVRDGNRYVGGSTNLLYRGDPIVSRLDSAGQEVWQRTFKTVDGDGFASIAATADGGVVGVGHRVKGKVDRDNWDALVVKFGADGEVRWKEVLGSDRRDQLTTVVALPDGSIVAGGLTAAQQCDEWCPWLLRLAPDGALKSARESRLSDWQ